MDGSQDARIALLEGLIDHAPLFPPASLDLPEAVAEDRRASSSAFSFALARFVCPASRLDELADVERRLSVVLDAPFTDDQRVEAVETVYCEDLARLTRLAPEVYVELAPDYRLDARLDELAARGFRAKVRCGGRAVPAIAELARFVRACRDRGLVFKATAGLHHAVRSGDEHGFLNLLAAAVFGDEENALGEDDPGAFELSRDSFRWGVRGARPDAIAAVRRGLFHSIGSCSFFEPVAELEALGVAPPVPA